MRRNPLLFVPLAGLCCVGVAVWLLTRDPPAQQRASTLHREPGGEQPTPSFHMASEDKHAPAIELARVESLPAAADEPATRSFSAGPVRRISGRVVRVSNGTGLPGVRVKAGGSADALLLFLYQGKDVHAVDPSVETHTDTDGRFEIPDVPVGIEQLTVICSRNGPDRSQPFPLPDVEGDITGLELTFEGGFLLLGVAHDAHGTPLAHASAAVENSAPVIANASGRFELVDVAPDAGRLSVNVWAEAPGFARDTRAVTVPADSSQIVSVEFALAGSGAIEGRISAVAGEPVSRTEVRLAATITGNHGESSPTHLRTTTGADGRYRLDHVPEGRYLVVAGSDPFGDDPTGDIDPDKPNATRFFVIALLSHARARERGLAQRWIPDIAVQTGATTQLDVTLDAGAIIEGFVSDSTGAPLAGASITLDRRVRWPAPALHGSSVSTDGTTTITSRRAGGDGADDAVGETVLESNERTTWTEADGSYQFQAVTAGEKRLIAQDDGQLCTPQELALTVHATELHTAVDFVLNFGLSLGGRVTGPGDVPLEGVSVSVRPEGTRASAPEASRVTDAEGWFQVDGLAQGPHVISFALSGCSPLSAPALPGEAPRTWILAPAPSLHGVVVDAASGAPLLRFGTCVALPGSTTTNGEDDQPEGRFDFDVDDDTPCTVSVFAVGYETATKQNVRPSSTAIAPLQFQLGRKP